MNNSNFSLQDRSFAGQAVYTKLFLNFYDFCVLGVSNSFIWKCPTTRILALYNQFITKNHLELGVGTGYYLDNCSFPIKNPRIVLGDLNLNCLHRTAQRIQRYRPTSLQVDVLKPFTIPTPRFDSVGINYLLHCLPDTMEAKGQVFAHIKELLNPEGVVFGSTVLFEGVERTALAEKVMNIYNSKKIFSNQNDSLEKLKEILNLHFSKVQVEVVGSVALFSAKN